MNKSDSAGVAVVVAATAVAWAGFFIHNIADLPGQTIVSAESLFPTLIWIAALTLWLVPRTRAAGAWMLSVWAAVNLVGGALSVLPLPVLPFTPEQTATHYAYHALYAATQIPLLIATIRWLRQRARARTLRTSDHGRAAS
jgi:hypothetical protein